MNTAWALIVSLFLLAANGFFVAAEFALISAKRHRLTELAADGSMSARLALRGSRHLTVTLAGAQLGITLCTLGLGALAKPAIAHLLDPALQALGLPSQVSYVVAFLVSIAVVVFLHMVVGEMAPKSWAISHPETSALAIAVPFEGYIWLTRPILAMLNGAANLSLRLAKVTPKDEIGESHKPEDLAVLLRQSREDGLLQEQQHRILSGVLRLRATTVEELMRPRHEVVTVEASADNDEVERVSLESGRSRLVALDGDRPLGIVHIRDALKNPGAGATDLLTRPLTLPRDTPISRAVATMRAERAQVALVTGDDGGLLGLVALEDLLEQVLGDFEDETDAGLGGA
ncbi:hemolysin family protein, partial [Phytomonospora endophytica]